MKWLVRAVSALVMLVIVLAAAIRLTTFHPPAVAAQDINCADDAPTLQPGQDVTVMTWNIQFLAGTDYVFFFDILDGSGPDTRPEPAAIARTLDDVVRVIEDVEPDVVLLQEVDDGADRTDGADQLQLILDELGDAWPCSASALYWQAAFVPHPKILGSVGMKLSTISRFQIDEATRYDLARIPNDLLTRQFDLRRAILETRLPVAGGEDLVVMNTHFDAFAQGSDTMQQQVAQAKELLDGLTSADEPWVFGGDLNLLPPGRQYDDLGPGQNDYYLPDSELAVLTDAYPSVPSVEEANGDDRELWFTHAPNRLTAEGLDRTIDFLLFNPSLELGEHLVRQDDTAEISDHLPVIATWTLP